MLVGNYSVFYVVYGERIVVTNVLYSASDIERRLKEVSQDKKRFLYPDGSSFQIFVKNTPEFNSGVFFTFVLTSPDNRPR